MPVFTIDSDLEVTARAAMPSNLGASIAFSSLDEFRSATKAWEGPALIKVWNNFAGIVPFDDLKPVKKFETRARATERIWTAIQRLANGHKDGAPLPEPEDLPKPKTFFLNEAHELPKEASAKPASGKPRAPKKQKSSAVEGKPNKRQITMALIKRKGGATLEDIIEATDSSRQSAANFVDYAKNNMKVTVEKLEGGGRRYTA
jgi:hypothetical protein